MANNNSNPGDNPNPPNPNKPPQRDLGSVTAVNRVALRQWTVTVQTPPSGKVMLVMQSYSQGMGRPSQGDPSADPEPLDEIHLQYERNIPIEDMEQDFQDAVMLIGEDIEGFATNDAFPEDDEEAKLPE